ncbi:hypothetical protein AB4072_02590 [Microvirga sp. 2MCAF38]|uniref:cadherin repeat domain-containing protein n=1 Tax=Microvirga sp. 2MCAF38 TaxID=3232989 RepID=UPI003F9DCE40
MSLTVKITSVTSMSAEPFNDALGATSKSGFNWMEEDGVSPTVTLEGTTVPEYAGGTSIGTFTCSDPSYSTFTFSNWMEEEDSHLFRIDNPPLAPSRLFVARGVVLKDSDVGTYDIYVLAYKTVGEVIRDTAIFKFTIEVTDVKTAPWETTLDGPGLLLEGTVGGTVVGALQTVDDDLNDVFEYKLVQEDGSDFPPGEGDPRFEIGTDENGKPAIVVKAGVTLGLSDIGDHFFYVKTNDGLHSIVSMLGVTVNVPDRDPASSTVADNKIAKPFADFGASLGGNVVATVTINDLSHGTLGNLGTGTFDAATGTYTVEGTAMDVNAAIRALTFDPTDRPGARVGAVETTIFTIRIEDDSKVDVREMSVSVESIAANRAPTNIALSDKTVQESAENGSLIATLSASDPNAGTSFTFTLIDDSNGRFAINGNKLIVKDGSKLDYEQWTSHQIKIKVSDNSGGSFEKAFIIAVTDVAEPGTIPKEDAPLTLRGTPARDVLVGGKSNDKLYGRGGKDILTGGDGQDIFVFDTKPNTKINVDRITDFSVADDTIHLAKATFSKIAKKGFLAKSAFYIGTKAHDADDRIIYNKKNGALYYDPDGTGAKAAIKIATLTKNLKMTEKDFFIV